MAGMLRVPQTRTVLPLGSAKPHGPQAGSALTWHQDWRLAVPSRYLMLSH